MTPGEEGRAVRLVATVCEDRDCELCGGAIVFEDRTEDYNRSEGGERHVRTVSDSCWISVLYRMTGFGYMEWETAICFSDPTTLKHVEGSPFIVRGDWRNELALMPEGRLLEWYAEKRVQNPISFDALLDALKSSA